MGFLVLILCHDRAIASQLLYFLPALQHGSIASYASAGGNSQRRDVNPSFCLYQNEQSQCHDFFTNGEPEDSSFHRYQVQPEI